MAANSTSICLDHSSNGYSEQLVQALVPLCAFLRHTTRAHLDRSSLPRQCSSPPASLPARFMLQRVDWIMLSLSAPTTLLQSGHALRIREALQTLALLAHIDIYAFRRFVAECWGWSSAEVDAVAYTERYRRSTVTNSDNDTHIGSNNDDDECAGMCAHFGLSFGGDAIADDVRGPEFLCAELFAPQRGPDVVGPAFQAAPLQTLEAIVQRNRQYRQQQQQQQCQETCVPVVRIPICLEFKPVGIGHRDLVELLCSILSIVRMRCDRPVGTTTSHDGPATYELEAVRLDLYSFAITSDIAALIEQLLALGVRVSSLAIPMRARELVDGSCSRLAQGSFLRAATAAVTSLTVQGQRATVEQVASLCSALAVAQHVPILNLFSMFDSTSRIERRAKWMWLAYALFSRRAIVSIGKLGINGHEMSVDDADAMVAVIQSLDPVSALVSSSSNARIESGGDVIRERTADVRAGTRIRLAPLDEGDSEWDGDILVLYEPAQLRIVSDDAASALLGVLVPGNGACWVDRQCVDTITVETAVASRARAIKASASHDVRALAIAFDMGETSGFAAIRRLLHAIGAPLQSLQLFQAYGFSLECLVDVLQCCPQLANLYIEGIELSECEMVKVIALFEAPVCTLSSLTLEDYVVSNVAITLLALALADGSTGVAKALKELHIGESTEAIVLNDENVLAFADMLDANRTLLHLELHIPQSLIDAYGNRFVVHDQTYVPVRKQRLPKHSRLAFLSLNTQPRFQHLLSHIDERVLALVFDFAAQASTRRVAIHATTD